MRRLALCLLVLLLFASVGFAQQNSADAPASKADIERFLEAMHTRDLLKTMTGTMTKQMHQMVHDLVKKQPNLPTDFEARMEKTTDDMLKDFPVDEYLEVVTPVYQKHLTKGDVDALVAFYASPTGQKFIQELPVIQAEAIEAASPIIQKMMAKAMERVQEEVAQAHKAAGPDSTKKTQQN
jgi:uncharacterized protein